MNHDDLLEQMHKAAFDLIPIPNNSFTLYGSGSYTPGIYSVSTIAVNSNTIADIFEQEELIQASKAPRSIRILKSSSYKFVTRYTDMMSHCGVPICYHQKDVFFIIRTCDYDGDLLIPVFFCLDEYLKYSKAVPSYLQFEIT